MSDTSVVAVGPKGRVVIPAAIRRELGLHQGRELVAMVEEGAVVLMPRDEIKRRLRAMFAHVRTSMADELIAERRAEAAREDAE
jgi:AbrB family looped-hinge helix DNA binding protein